MEKWTRRQKSNNAKFILIASLMASIYAIGLYIYAARTEYSDFPIFYNAAHFFLHSNNDLVEVYKESTLIQNQLPEKTNDYKFMYSLAALVIMSPLGYFDYYISKTALMLAGTASYLLSIHIILRQLELRDRWYIYPFALMTVWMPFLADVMFAQINSILFLLVVLAVYNLNKKKPVTCGSLLGVATLLKLFPIGFAVVLGFRNWRVWGAGLLIFGASFLIPGSMEWFSAMQQIHPTATSPAFSILARESILPFLAYSALIAAITVSIIYWSNEEDPIKTVAYLIPGIFIAVPVYEYYHLVFLVIPHLYLIKQANATSNLKYAGVLGLSIFLITFEFFAKRFGFSQFSGITYISLLLLWMTYSRLMLTGGTAKLEEARP